jgi:hypothetical protein
MIELATEGAAKGCNARRIPVREIGQSAIFDFAVLAIGLAKKNGRGESCDWGWWRCTCRLNKTPTF